jgi:hypothetical protein
MSSEESNKISNQIHSQDLLSNEEWIDRLYNDLLDSHNEPDAKENFFDIWDKEYARRQLRRRMELEEE